MNDPTIHFYIDGDILVHTAAWGSEKASDVHSKINKSVISIIEDIQGEEGKIAIKGKGNFRHDISPIYKGNRKSAVDEQKAEMMGYAYAHLKDYWGAIEAHGQEADDLLTTWAHEKTGIICSIDKDLHQFAGFHYNFRKKELIEVTEDQGSLLLHQQILMGDATDNIKGIPGIGIKKAEAALEGVSPKNYLSTCRMFWQKEFGRGWEKEMQLTADLVYLRRFEGDRYLITPTKGDKDGDSSTSV